MQWRLNVTEKLKVVRPLKEHHAAASALPRVTLSDETT